MKLAIPALLTLACSPSFSSTLRVPGVDTPIPYEQSGSAQVASLRRIAEAALQCNEIAIDRKQRTDVLRARGCSRQILYFRVIDVESRETLDGFSAEIVTHEALQFVDLTALPADAPLYKDRSDLVLLVRLNEQAAKDLDCPRDQVVPEMQSLGRGASMPIAEGCGKRASYVPGASAALRFIGKVDAPDGPTGFTPWLGDD